MAPRTCTPARESLKRALDSLYRDYDFAARVRHDPIQLPKHYSDPRDVEAAAFISSCLAYGSVKLFIPVAARLLGKMGSSPFAFLACFDTRRDGKRFRGIKYRFNETEDILALFHATGTLLRRHGSLEHAFLSHTRGSGDISSGLSGLVDEALAVDTTAVYGRNVRPRGYVHFLPAPRSGSACKRANLFLRWMVRAADIDFGIWGSRTPAESGTGRLRKDRGKVTPANLVIPLDRHIQRVGRCLGLTARKTPDWKMALEITDSLRALDPADPLRYDFALCHRGIAGLCAENACARCRLVRYARGRRKRAA